VNCLRCSWRLQGLTPHHMRVRWDQDMASGWAWGLGLALDSAQPPSAGDVLRGIPGDDHLHFRHLVAGLRCSQDDSSTRDPRHAVTAGRIARRGERSVFDNHGCTRNCRRSAFLPDDAGERWAGRRWWCGRLDGHVQTAGHTLIRGFDVRVTRRNGPDHSRWGNACNGVIR
jgi:hypothetical protein